MDLRVQELTKAFGSASALRDVSFDACPGTPVVLLGPNGAGKTTLLRVLAGYLTPDGGSVTFDGAQPTKPEVRQHIGFLPETVPLHPELSVRQHIEFAARMRGVPRHRRRAAVKHALERTATGTVERRLFGSLSRGYRQRVGFAHAIAGEPAVLLLDEPTSALDPEQLSEARELILELAQDHLVLVSTHILGEAARMRPRMLVFDGGELVSDRRPHETDNLFCVGVRLRGAELNDVRARLEPVGGDVRAKLGPDEAIDVEVDGVEPHLVASAIIDAGWQLLRVGYTEPTLEDDYLGILRGSRRGG